MNGETDLTTLIRNMSPRLNDGEYVFCFQDSLETIDPGDIIGMFKEEEGLSVILERKKADALKLSYDAINSWITLTVHSSLKTVGLTASFSRVLAENGISCNVVAAYHHDHIFVDKKDSIVAMELLRDLSSTSNIRLF